MAHSTIGDVLVYLRKVCAVRPRMDLADGDLLKRFVTERDEAAFTVLVQRHGPAVLGVCRRVLGDGDGAEDAFQATFLVLVRRAASLAKQQPLGGWLYSVAQRIASKARAQAAAQRQRERRAADMPRNKPSDDLAWQELRSILDEEIAGLPEKYRNPLVLCYFEGKSHAQAAKELGWRPTSLSSRLERGRELLRQRLVRRGITLSAATVATLLGDKAGATAVGALLTINTVKAALSVATGKAVVGGVLSARALALAEEAVAGMMAIKAKVMVLVVTLGLLLSGAGLAGYQALTGNAGQLEDVAAHAQLPKVDPTGLPKKDEQPTDQYRDALPAGALARLGTVRFRHDGRATRLVYAPDGKILVGYTESGVNIWDAATGKELQRLAAGRTSGVLELDISPDGTMLAVGTFSAEARDNQAILTAVISLWELKTGKKTPAFSVRHQTGNRVPLRFAPDGKSLALTCNGNLFIFDLKSGELGKIPIPENATTMKDFNMFAVAPDGKTIAVSNNGDSSTVQLLDIGSNKWIRSIPIPLAKGLLSSIAFSPDGKLLAVGTVRRGKDIILCDVATGKVLREFGEGMPVTDLAFTPDGKSLVSGGRYGGKKVQLWDVATGEVRRTMDGRASEGISMALSPDGKTIALGSYSQAIRLWDLATGAELLTQFQGHDSKVNCLAFSSDGKALVSADESGPIRVWDTATWKQTQTVKGSGSQTLSLAPDGKQLLTIKPGGTTAVQLWDAAAGPSEIEVPDCYEVLDATFTADGRSFLTINSGSVPGIADPKKAAISPLTLRKWDLPKSTQDRSWTLPLQVQHALLVAPDGKTVLGVYRDALCLFDVELKRSRLFHNDGKDYFNHLALSPDGRVLASGGGPPNFDIRLWEMATGKEILRIKGHESLAGAFAWSPDNRLLASSEYRHNASEPATFGRQTVHIWDAATGKKVKEFSGFRSNVLTLAFSPDGKYLAGGLKDSTIVIWEVGPAAAKLAPRKLDKAELETCWADLGAGPPAAAHQAIWTLVASPNQSVPFLRAQLKPVAAANAGKVQQWIAELDSEKFAVRQAAAKELEKAGEQVKGVLQKSLKDSLSLEVRRRLEAVLNALPDVPGSETLRTMRAIMALERIGSLEARAVLETLAAGAPGARETEDAKMALARLGNLQ